MLQESRHSSTQYFMVLFRTLESVSKWNLGQRNDLCLLDKLPDQVRCNHERDISATVLASRLGSGSNDTHRYEDTNPTGSQLPLVKTRKPPVSRMSKVMNNPIYDE